MDTPQDRNEGLAQDPWGLIPLTSMVSRIRQVSSTIGVLVGKRLNAKSKVSLGIPWNDPGCVMPVCMPTCIHAYICVTIYVYS